MDNYKCCNNPKYKKAYIVFPIFKAKYCTNCGEVISTMNPIVGWIFEHFFIHIWYGMVCVTDEDTK